MKKLIWYLVVLLLIAVAIYSIYIFTCNEDRCMKFDWQRGMTLTSFEQCVSAGYSVTNTIPRQCIIGNKVFTEGSDMSKGDLIKVSNPVPGQSISSPFIAKGEARGNWYFEASFPIKVYDANGKLLGISVAQAQEEWMTTNFVPFQSEIKFSTSTTATGTLVFEKDNPSGLPENDNQLVMPIAFSNIQVSERAVKLFYYDQSKDVDSSSNVLCSRQGLVSVDRNIPITQTPIQDTIKMLILGNLSSVEKSRGVSSEFPLPGFMLQGASLNNGVLTLSFADPLNKTLGGSCRVSILWAQVEATAKQFPGITSVKFSPDTLFQP